MSSKLIPVPLYLPEYTVNLAQNAPLAEPNTASKIRALMNHFLNENLPVPDMSAFQELEKSKSFTLRLSSVELDALSAFCQRTLYTRQQAFQIAIVASLQHLKDLY